MSARGQSSPFDPRTCTFSSWTTRRASNLRTAQPVSSRRRHISGHRPSCTFASREVPLCRRGETMTNLPRATPNLRSSRGIACSSAGMLARADSSIVHEKERNPEALAFGSAWACAAAAFLHCTAVDFSSLQLLQVPAGRQPGGSVHLGQLCALPLRPLLPADTAQNLRARCWGGLGCAGC